MQNQSSQLSVLIDGAVTNPGHYELVAPRTLESALATAGGLARTTTRWAAGPIHVRRREANLSVSVWEFNLSDEPATWRSFKLHPKDLVVFTWHIELS